MNLCVCGCLVAFECEFILCACFVAFGCEFACMRMFGCMCIRIYMRVNAWLHVNANLYMRVGVGLHVDVDVYACECLVTFESEFICV